MNKEAVKELLAYCYICQESLLDSPDHIYEWVFTNIDGVNAPVCWACKQSHDSRQGVS